MIKSLLRHLGLRKWLGAGWPDAARYHVQSEAVRDVLQEQSLSGECLNAGAGEGLFSPLLESFKQITRITNVDLECPRISRVREDARHRDFAGSLTELPFADGQFNCAICTEVLEHITDDEAAIRELARVLKPGSILIVTVPSPPAPFDPAHVREGYTLDELSTKLRSNGFEPGSHRFCFHFFMRSLLQVWRWQYENLGHRKKSVMPNLFVLAFGWMDRLTQWGKPWDLVIIARRT